MRSLESSIEDGLSPAAGDGLESGLDKLLAALRHNYGDLVAYVRQHAARFGGDQSHARDIVHDVCLELIAAPPRQAVRTPLAFLREVSRRRAIDHYRADRARSRFIETTDVLPEVADPGCVGRNPAQLLAARQTLLVLVRAIEALPPRCRDVFVLCKIHEFGNAAAAEHLDISVKTVEKHLRLGLAHCRAALEAAA